MLFAIWHLVKWNNFTSESVLGLKFADSTLGLAYVEGDILYLRMAVALWSSKTPGAAQLERDIAVMNNKKKVHNFLLLHLKHFMSYSR